MHILTFIMDALLMALFYLQVEGYSVSSYDARTLERSRRGVWNGIVSSVTCAPKAIEISRECAETLEQSLNGRKDTDNIHVTCCLNASFRNCVFSKVKQVCGEDASNVYDLIISGALNTNSKECAKYDAYDPVCLMIIWWNYIVLSGIVAILLTIGFICGACYRR